MDWNAITLVVFDMDGTLYDQRRLRLRMAHELLLHALATISMRELRVLSAYRRLRERLAEKEVYDIDRLLVAQTARRCGIAEEVVRAVVMEWMEHRPLPHLPACRYEGLPELFRLLRARGKRIAILSDYPAQAKLQACGLAADIVVCSSDAAVGVLKPHPRGLQHVMALAAVAPAATLMLGDRPDRDGQAARRSGVQALIKSRHPLPGWQTFVSYRDPVFTVQL
jgi:FMN phosphatase YigB (HAD superfamily)